MIFNVGELLAYGETGVCRVEELFEKQVGEQTKTFYKLMPVFSSCVIITPVDNTNIFMRPIISAQDARQLADSMREIEPDIFFSSAPKELIEKYDKIIKLHDIHALAKLIRSINAKRDILASRKKKLSAIDERYYKKASDLLIGELACALQLPKEEIAGIVTK